MSLGCGNGSVARTHPAHRRTLVLAALLGLAGAAAGLAQPLAAREVIEALGTDESLRGPIVILTGLVVAAAFVTPLHFWLLERTAQRIVLRARRGLTGRVLRLRMGELDRLAPGDLVARATSDTTLLGEVASTGLVQSFNGVIALLRYPRLLLLDEAASQLDAVNEQALRAAVAAAAAERAVLAIAHRLSTVVAADHVVLDGGRVRAQGTHPELVEADELYRALAASQLTA